MQDFYIFVEMEEGNTNCSEVAEVYLIGFKSNRVRIWFNKKNILSNADKLKKAIDRKSIFIHKVNGN